MHKTASTAIKAIDRDMPDIELARQVAAGDQQAFELLMRRCNRPLYRTARSIVRDDAEAEDVVQEAYLHAYRSIGNFRSDAKLQTWLTRIVVNEAIARSRKASRRAEVIRLDGDVESMAEVDTHDEFGEQPERAAMRDETRRLLEKKIDGLPAAFRTVFVLRALEEMSVEEVAVALGIPEATVRTRFFRARSLLREALSREIDFALEDAFTFGGERCDRIVAAVLKRLDDSNERNQP
ncbi:RNA polymerase sigma factor [Noviherbaspirillum cavernae]|uniref:RNA polymerase sigma factor n=1 Tax=Noviherbaspirillum cavernae TaxID=2320862 RepID=A0A418WVB2_9BURK|nr:RNA polymerase sigma factor [Noviherbaspirillum cavernae]RJF96634.1 RNA polymerase sigma factor [Noviherbaspirillum cavernae]